MLSKSMKTAIFNFSIQYFLAGLASVLEWRE
jgi:hypothetical protein